MMRRWMLATLPATLLVLETGCTKQSYVDRQKVNDEPLVIDQAMRQRNWAPISAKYENGGTYSGSTGFAYGPNHDVPPYLYSVTDTGTFLVNVVTLPYTLLFGQRDGVVSGGVELPPSYTAAPPATAK